MSVIPERKNKHCEGCPLEKSSVVFGKGNIDAPIVIVGDYPREDEQEPFSGFLGDRLRDVLKKSEIPWGETYRTYAIKCRLPEGVNSASKTAREALEHCKGKVKKEIQLISPQTTVIAGDLPLQAIFDTKKISDHRGVWKEHPTLGRFMPTYSIMAIFRGQPKMGKTVEEDFYMVGRDFNGDSKDEYRTEWKVLDNVSDIKKFIERLKKYFKKTQSKIPVSADSETTCWDYEAGKIKDICEGIKMPATKYQFPDFLCLSFSYRKGTGIVVPLLGYEAKPIWTPKEEKIIFNLLKEIFEDPESIWSFHNGMADVRWIFRILKVDIRKMNFHDTMLMIACLNENYPMSLEDVASMLTDMGNYKNALNAKYK